MARREIAAAVVNNHVLTVAQLDNGMFQFKQEFPTGGCQTSTRQDVRDAFKRMGEETRLLLHQEEIAARESEVDPLEVTNMISPFTPTVKDRGYKKLTFFNGEGQAFQEEEQTFDIHECKRRAKKLNASGLVVVGFFDGQVKARYFIVGGPHGRFYEYNQATFGEEFELEGV